MKAYKIIIFSLFFISLVLYIGVKSYVYQLDYTNYELEIKIDELDKENSELYIYVTTLYSRTDIVNKYPELSLNNNIYYLEEEN